MSKSVNITVETHKKLVALKQSKSETFNDVLVKLLDLEDKYNPRDDIIYEYEYIFEGGSRTFLVMFGTNNVKIKYYSQREHRFESNIRAWNSKASVPSDILDLFISFIVKDSNLYVLYEMEEELIINGVHIRRVG